MDVVLWVRPVPYTGSDIPDGPTIADAKLSQNIAYRVLGVHDNGVMDSEAYFSVINEEGEVWFVSNRYFRVAQVEGQDGVPINVHGELVAS